MPSTTTTRPDAWAERLRTRFADLENQRRAKLVELDELRIVAEREQPQQPELLDMLPQLPLDLADVPDPLRRGLYEACGMKIYYGHASRNVTIRATLRGETGASRRTSSRHHRPEQGEY